MHMFEMRQLHWYHMQGRWVYTIKSCRSLPESFSHIIFPCQAMSSHVKPCQFAQEGNLRVVHMLLQQKALPSGFHWGSKGTRRPRKIIRELMGTHRNSWEAWSRANLLHSVESASLNSLKILYPISSYLWSDSYTLRLICKNGRFYGLYEQEKRDTNWYNLVLSCQSFPFDYPNAPFDLHLRWIPSKRLLVVGQHWLWQRTGGWAVIHGALEIDGTGPKFGSEMIFYR